MVGIDEVGRGCWAGPLLVVAARARTSLPPGLKDSKLLGKIHRMELIKPLCTSCDFGEGWVSPSEIDEIGIAESMRLGVSRALRSLSVDEGEEIIMDGSINYCSENYKKVKCAVGADRDIPIVSAASIYAKVKRDNFMKQLEKQYPAFGFEKHVGYGTKSHRQALIDYGALRGIHRYSFRPIKLDSL